VSRLRGAAILGHAMCLLIVLRGFHDSHPVVVAGNRDERLDRKASPPGLWANGRRPVLSPRDRRAGGTWLAVNDAGMFAGLTNVAGAEPLPGAPSRGHLPHLALEQDDLDAAAAAVAAAVAGRAHSAFQLVLCDGTRTLVLRHRDGQVQTIDWQQPLLVVSNEHGPGQLELPLLHRALGATDSAAARLEMLKPLLLDRGGVNRHPILKKGEEYGTVSSSLIAVPRPDPRELIWLYAAGSPDEAPYKNYGNLGRRLAAE
jgi:hypothetical protein